MSAVPSLSPETLARLTPLGGLAPASLAQAAALGRRETLPRSLRTQDFPWSQEIVYLLKGEMKLDYAGGGMEVLVGGSDAALSPIGRGGDPVGLRAITEAEILHFDAKALDIIVTWDQAAATAANDAADSADWRALSGIFDARRLTQGTFASLPPAHIESLLACFRRQRVRAEETVVRQGEPGDYYYVIERGRARVTREVAGACIDLAELEAGDAFGEEALIAETARNATVTMLSDGELLRLDGADFVRLLREPLLQRIDAAEAERRIAAGACWLDVRFPAEYRHDGLPGALNIPLNELREALPGLRRDREYVVYCQSGRRSSAAAFLLSQRGVRASLLEGGLKAMTAKEKRAA